MSPHRSHHLSRPQTRHWANRASVATSRRATHTALRRQQVPGFMLAAQTESVQANNLNAWVGCLYCVHALARSCVYLRVWWPCALAPAGRTCASNASVQARTAQFLSVADDRFEPLESLFDPAENERLVLTIETRELHCLGLISFASLSLRIACSDSERCSFCWNQLYCSPPWRKDSMSPSIPGLRTSIEDSTIVAEDSRTWVH
eukprot:7379470-Prymnesium_polylepis.2